ncbi:MAG: hypothetical protein ACXWO1_17420, partial [Isosphaeraceae bacterium]
SNKCTVLWKIAAMLITVSTSVNKEMWVKLSLKVEIKRQTISSRSEQVVGASPWLSPGNARH